MSQALNGRVNNVICRGRFVPQCILLLCDIKLIMEEETNSELRMEMSQETKKSDDIPKDGGCDRVLRKRTPENVKR